MKRPLHYIFMLLIALLYCAVADYTAQLASGFGYSEISTGIISNVSGQDEEYTPQPAESIENPTARLVAPRFLKLSINAVSPLFNDGQVLVSIIKARTKAILHHPVVISFSSVDIIYPFHTFW